MSENSNIIDVTETEFNDQVIEASESKLIVVDFWAPWCGPCKQLTPILEKIISKSGDKINLVKINIDENDSPKYLPLSNYGKGKKGTVKLIFEDEQLSKILNEQGIRPGNKIMLKNNDNNVYSVETDKGNFSIDRKTASKIIIQN